MARKVILDTYYTFIPSSRTIIIPHVVPKERLVLITDLTTNQVIYNFSDPNLTTTAYTVGLDTTGNYPNATVTTVSLAYNTTALSATDKLSIVVDEYNESFQPSETLLDPVNKLRVSTPQSLIDTDFEYSTQATKWESLARINMRPFSYYTVATGNLNLIDIQAVNGSRSFTANTTGTTPPAVGTPITILDSLYAGADGNYVVDSNNNLTNTNASGAANTFNYTGKFYYTGTTGTIYNQNVTIGYQGYAFTNSAITIAGMTTSGQNVFVTTANAHGFMSGNEIAVTGVTGTNPPNGSWVVSTIINPYNFVYQCNAASIPSGTMTVSGASLYARPVGTLVHRSFDGGIRFSTNSGSHNQQFIRQTRKYFRYQSGKGIQLSTGTTLQPQFNLDGITSSGTTVTVTTKDPHNISASIGIAVANANEAAYNGNFAITNVLNPYQFQYTANSVPANSPASGNYVCSATTWYGSSNRIGIFDDQNGMFFEYDGSQLYAVRRNSVYQISGNTWINAGSNTLNGNNTIFTKQLQPNDFIVIKGMPHRVHNILTDSVLTVVPTLRGTQNVNSAVISKIQDVKTPVSQFNIDRLDGTGPSGYKIDLTKDQMFYIDYSWYGAGFQRWGVRGPDGNVIYAHKVINNNVNYLAYMRSGNLPGRYETNSFSKTSVLTANVAPTDTTITISNATGWPNTGVAVIRNTSNTEYFAYTGITALSNGAAQLTGAQRGAAYQTGNTGNTLYVTTVAGNNIVTIPASNTTYGLSNGMYVFGANIAPQTFIQNVVANTYLVLNQAPTASGTSTVIIPPLANIAQTVVVLSATGANSLTYTGNNNGAVVPTAVELHAPLYGPEINHWGTSAIMDGGFTPDKSFIFSKGMQTSLTIYPAGGAANTMALWSFRVAPSASNGIPASALGVREIVNRMQQLPFELDAYSNGACLMTLVLNGSVSNTTAQWQNVGGSSLSQYVFHAQNTTVSGGETVFGFFLNNNLGTFGSTQNDLTQLLSLGTSIQSGGVANTGVGIYPDGPDVLTLVATNVSSTNLASILARYSWTEAQA
jgi:hypothetical protein